MRVSTISLFRSPKGRAVIISLCTIGLVYAVIAASRGLFVQPSTVQTEEQIRVAVEAVGKIMELPQEKPTIASVSDVTKLPAGQPFFANAKNGDTVLFYNDAKKAILYRPETKKIINVAPILVNPVTP